MTHWHDTWSRTCSSRHAPRSRARGVLGYETRSQRVTRSRRQIHKVDDDGSARHYTARRISQPASQQENYWSLTPVDELLELLEDWACASSVELATECILSSSLDVHWLRLRRNCPAILYDWRMRLARDELRQRLRTWCTCCHRDRQTDRQTDI